MNGHIKTPYVERTEGWALVDRDLIKYPYALSRHATDEQRNALCAEFKRMVFENGVPVRPSEAHTPDYLALTEEELRDTTRGSRASIQSVSMQLRQAAFEKFAPLSNPAVPPSHVVLPVEPAQIVVLYSGPRQKQMAAAIPSDEHQLQMKG